MAENTLAIREKVCTGCGKTLAATLEFFCRHPTGKFRLQSKCRACSRALVREWSATPRGKAKRVALRAQPKHREKQRAYDREKWQTPEYRERKKALDKERNGRPDVLARRAAQRRERRLNGEVKAREHAFNRSPGRREWSRNWQPKYFYERERRDPQFKLRLRMGTAVREALQARGESKRGRKVESLVGYTIAGLKAHLERQFTKGMSWKNYGDWHVDHIRPIISFDYKTTDDPGFRECWALSNLRPLWSAQNISKGGKRLFLL